MVTPFAVSKQDGGAGRSWLRVTGELDQDTGDGLAGLIANAAEQAGVTEVIVDLGHVTFLDASGVRALLEGHDATSLRNCGFRVVNAHGLVHQVLDSIGLIGVLRVTSMKPAEADTGF
ncbi:STAS domain-containing protein [Actinoplanes sp. GCM10030250]|uniref:STAS domain-containing protein n=1 Tax=Actinoplanes sp. GCM10030250 TaxID=3273376 RepID=UPI00360851A3